MLRQNNVNVTFVVGFPTGWDSATFRDKGTEFPSLYRDKGTMGQTTNLDMGRDGPGQPIKIWDRTGDGTINIFLSKSGMGQDAGQDNHYFLHYFLF